ncbi:PepSY domain-containing protein [Achromobacter pestifer]|uniref:PepSY domain-containing protein n=1 Tax=Achromobacter pestifer TaxID=1353889 RepID=A0A7D4E2T9_9BURK|nr:PepSY-associated TM helix domain-containing protein [Achromobacter pestifer]QKH37494.1 PepSY domain-containing protein [Achromobacter pestifer]
MNAYPEGSLRQRMAWLHTWVGLLFGWLAFSVFLTGALSVYAPEISLWMKPENSAAGRADQSSTLDRAQDWLARNAAAAASWRIELPDARRPLLTLSWEDDQGGGAVLLDPASGREIVPRDTEGGDFLVEFHYSLHAGQAGIWVVGACTLALLAALVSGVIVHRRFFADFFLFRPRASSGRAWLDAHDVLSVLPLPFHCMILLTALSTLLLGYLPAGVQSRYGGDVAAMVADVFPQPPVSSQRGGAAVMPPLAGLAQRAEAELGAGKIAAITVRQPGTQGALADVWRRYDDRLLAFPDRVSLDAATGRIVDVQTVYPGSLQLIRTLGGLHYGYYAAPLLRALYFLLALSGAAMIATGLVLYTARPAAASSRFGRAAHRLNVAMVCGPICACAAYLLANRLAWPHAAGLHDREVTVFFLAWMVCGVHALVRGERRLWTEQWRMAALLWLAVAPVDLLAMAFDASLRPAWARPLHLAVWAASVAAACVFGYMAHRSRKRRE